MGSADEINREGIKHQLAVAAEIARGMGDDQVVALHLLVAMVEEPDDILQKVLAHIGVRSSRLVSRAREVLRRRPRRPASGVREMPRVATELNLLLRSAADVAEGMGLPGPEPIHVLLAMSRTMAGDLAQILRGEQVHEEVIERAIESLMGGGKAKADAGGGASGGGAAAAPSGGNDPLAQYCQEMGRDPAHVLIGRERELQQLIRVLGQRHQSHPLLVGDPGVGKTALVEGLARLIVAGQVPPTVRGCRVLSVDLAKLRVGTSYRGEFEARLRGVVDAATAAGNTILFLDDIHALFDGAGNEAATALRPCLARGTLRFLGATNHESYRKMLGEDAAFCRRFQVVTVEEPDENEAIEILRGLRPALELHHTLAINDHAVEAAVRLSRRYLRDQFLPDKALALVDQAAAMLRVELENGSSTIGDTRRKIVHLEVERDMLAARHGDRTEAVDGVGKKIAEQKAALETALALQQEQRELVEKVFEMRGRPGVTPASTLFSEGRIDAVEKDLAASAKRNRLLHWRVESPEVARVLSEKTGIPVDRMLSTERERLLSMEQEVGRRVIGQDAAVGSVCRAVRKARAGFSRKRKPIGSFFFMGPTGTGKTELAKALAEFLFDDDQHMVRLDMSEFREEHSASRLIGAPHGYVGFSEGGVLTNSVRRNPFSIVLFDEIEKAHPQISTLLLQVLDEGHLSDASNRRVDFSNTIIVFTSNLGSEEVLKQGMAPTGSSTASSPGSGQAPGSGPDVRGILKRFFRPELINRLDDIVVFNPLNREAIGRIVDLQLAEVLEQARQQGVGLTVTPEAREKLAQDGFDPEYGARPLRRLIDRVVADPLSLMMIRGEIPPGSQLELAVEGGQCTIRRRNG